MWTQVHWKIGRYTECSLPYSEEDMCWITWKLFKWNSFRSDFSPRHHVDRRLRVEWLWRTPRYASMHYAMGSAMLWILMFSLLVELSREIYHLFCNVNIKFALPFVKYDMFVERNCRNVTCMFMAFLGDWWVLVLGYQPCERLAPSPASYASCHEVNTRFCNQHDTEYIPFRNSSFVPGWRLWTPP